MAGHLKVIKHLGTQRIRGNRRIAQPHHQDARLLHRQIQILNHPLNLLSQLLRHLPVVILILVRELVRLQSDVGALGLSHGFRPAVI